VLEEAKRELSAEAFAQEYLAEFRKKEGLVYKEFDHETHIKTADQWKDLQMIDTIAGIDFGFNNPSAMVVIKKDFDNRFWVVDEWKKSRMTTTEVAERAKNLSSNWGINAFYPDPASPEHIEDIRKLGVNVRDSNKDVAKGIEKIASLLKNNRLFIDASCSDLIAEMDSYSYPDMSERRGVSNKNEAEKPIKENDHLLDALRYALFTSEPTLQVTDQNFGIYAGSYK
jgi:phage terminase large subunit